MKSGKLIRIALAVAATAGIVGGGAGVASATPHGAGMDCQVFADPMTCYTGGDVYQGTGMPTTSGPVGRTFVTDTDVEYIGDSGMTAVYDAAQWDSYFDFEIASEMYWNLHKPAGGCWIDVADPNAGSASNPCTSSTYDTQLNADGTQSVTFHHH